MMEPDRWQRIDELFHQVLELEADERSRVLERECGADAGLRAHVEALLRAHDADVSVLDAGPGIMVSLLHDDATSAVGRRIGSYRVVRELGRGGMGVVYLAEREDADFRQVVALKCPLPGVATADLVDRFRRERRIRPASCTRTSPSSTTAASRNPASRSS
jgi:serine/threonine-protein kinase